MNEDFHKTLMASVQERLRVIAGNEERLVEAWVAQHGFKPDECCIVRQDMQDGTVKMWVEKRGDFSELQRFRAREPLVQALIDKSGALATTTAADSCEGEGSVNKKQREIRARGEQDAVQELGSRIGYGRTMQLCELLWREKMNGAEHTVGPCGVFMVPCGCVESVRTGETACDWCCGSLRLTKHVRAMQRREPMVQFLIEAAERTDDGFGGWPLRDIVKALRDFGQCDSSATETTDSAAGSSGLAGDE